MLSLMESGPLFTQTCTKFVLPSRMPLEMDVRQFQDLFAPAYGGDWASITKTLLFPGDDRNIIMKLVEERLEAPFNEPVVVMYDQSDVDDRELWTRQVQNGMHRVIASWITQKPVRYQIAHDPYDYDHDPWVTTLRIRLCNDPTDEEFDAIFSFFRSMRLVTGEWVESVGCMAQDIDIDIPFYHCEDTLNVLREASNFFESPVMRRQRYSALSTDICRDSELDER